jgi:ankyrin repeat protein
MAALDAYEEEHMERLLRVGTCLAQCGFGAQVGQLAACARAFRADAQLWGAHARHKGPRGRTVLMDAACEGDVPRIQFLLERGADVEAVDEEYGFTALMLACEAGHCEAARVLVERGGANVNAACTSDGYTALMWASEQGHLEIVRFLVERMGANVNAARTTDGLTALMLASQNGHLEIVRLLVEYGGTNVNAAMTTDGYTALFRASQFATWRLCACWWSAGAPM